MGRRAVTAERKEARGNPGRRPIAPKVQAPAAEGDARAPAWLSAEAVEIWSRLAPGLTSSNLLKRPDELTFGRYCQMFALWLRANLALQAGELVTVTESAHVTMERLNKNLSAMLLLDRRLEAFEDRFGLNPAERQRIFAQRAAATLMPGELPLRDEPEKTPIGFLVQ